MLRLNPRLIRTFLLYFMVRMAPFVHPNTQNKYSNPVFKYYYHVSYRLILWYMMSSFNIKEKNITVYSIFNSRVKLVAKALSRYFPEFYGLFNSD